MRGYPDISVTNYPSWSAFGEGEEEEGSVLVVFEAPRTLAASSLIVRLNAIRPTCHAGLSIHTDGVLPLLRPLPLYLSYRQGYWLTPTFLQHFLLFVFNLTSRHWVHGGARHDPQESEIQWILSPSPGKRNQARVSSTGVFTWMQALCSHVTCKSFQLLWWRFHQQ